jgi:hypothetical protein
VGFLCVVAGPCGQSAFTFLKFMVAEIKRPTFFNEVDFLLESSAYNFQNHRTASSLAGDDPRSNPKT